MTEAIESAAEPKPWGIIRWDQSGTTTEKRLYSSADDKDYTSVEHWAVWQVSGLPDMPRGSGAYVSDETIIRPRIVHARWTNGVLDSVSIRGRKVKKNGDEHATFDDSYSVRAGYKAPLDRDQLPTLVANAIKLYERQGRVDGA